MNPSRIRRPVDVRRALHSRHNNHNVVTLYEIISKMIYKYCDRKESIRCIPLTLSQRIIQFAVTWFLKNHKMFSDLVKIPVLNRFVTYRFTERFIIGIISTLF